MRSRWIWAAVLALTVLAAMPLSGCMKQYSSAREAEADGAVLGERIFIDGADVSNMTVGEARDAIEASRRELLMRTVYTLAAGEDEAAFTADELPAKFDTDGAILEALNVSRRCPEELPAREFSSFDGMEAEALRALIARYAKKLERAPVDAAAEYDGEGFVYTPDAEGRSVDVMELAERLMREGQLAGGRFEAVTAAVLPEYTLDMVKADTELISEFTTSFSGSTYSKKNRVFNITKAAKLINGVCVPAGESFDMNAVLGDRNEKNGWRTATAIRDGAYTQEYGGGVCQVSTTLYNASLMADLEVVERHHHSWPLGYVGVGMDATISTDGPNLIVKNTSGAPVYVGAYADTDEKTITVRLYGRREFEGRIEITSRKVSTLDAAGYETELDASLPYGTKEEARKQRRGCVSETYKNYYDAGGALIRTELVCRDKYRSIKGLIKLSTDLYYGAEAALTEPAG